MAKSNYQERASLKKEKERISDVVKEIYKIQHLNKDEEMLLDEILKYALSDCSGKYSERHVKNKRYYYLACGILYNHLRSKEIDHGIPTFPVMQVIPDINPDDIPF